MVGFAYFWREARIRNLKFVEQYYRTMQCATQEVVNRYTEAGHKKYRTRSKNR
jgi:hypothetical protein